MTKKLKFYYPRTTHIKRRNPQNYWIYCSPAKGVVLDNGSESSNLSFSAKVLENQVFKLVPEDFLYIVLLLHMTI